MRIISGKYRGRRINAPNSKYTRPTTDRLKESIFNMLQNRIDFAGIKVLDIYAGSGSLGLEALSRGAEEIHFVEQNFSVYKVLQANIENIGVQSETKIIKQNALKFSKLENHSNYSLILADPPFFKDDIHDVFKNLINNNFLNENGILIVERSIQTKEKDIEAFGMEPKKKLGDSLIYWYES